MWECLPPISCRASASGSQFPANLMSTDCPARTRHLLWKQYGCTDPNWSLCEAFIPHKGFYIQKLSHTATFIHRSFYTQILLHRTIFTDKNFCTYTLSHTEMFIDVIFLQTESFADIRVYIQTLSRAQSFYKQIYLITFVVHGLTSCRPKRLFQSRENHN